MKFRFMFDVIREGEYLFTWSKADDFGFVAVEWVVVFAFGPYAYKLSDSRCFFVFLSD